MLKQICFFRKRPGMTMEEFVDYYENHHSKLGQKIGKPSIPNAVSYVRRYLAPVKNPVTGEIHDCGYDCIMEIWWNNREDFERSQAIVADPQRLPRVRFADGPEWRDLQLGTGRPRIALNTYGNAGSKRP